MGWKRKDLSLWLEDSLRKFFGDYYSLTISDLKYIEGIIRSLNKDRVEDLYKIDGDKKLSYLIKLPTKKEVYDISEEDLITQYHTSNPHKYAYFLEERDSSDISNAKFLAFKSKRTPVETVLNKHLYKASKLAPGIYLVQRAGGEFFIRYKALSGKRVLYVNDEPWDKKTLYYISNEEYWISPVRLPGDHITFSSKNDNTVLKLRLSSKSEAYEVMEKLKLFFGNEGLKFLHEITMKEGGCTK